MFFSSRKTVLKSWLDTSSTPLRYLAICRAFQAFFLSQSQQLLDTWWIDRASVLGSDSLLLDTSAVDDHFLDTFLDSFLDTSRHMHLSRFTEGLYILSSRSISHFFDLSRSVHTCSSPKHSLFLTPNLFLCDFSSFLKILPLLVSF